MYRFEMMYHDEALEELWYSEEIRATYYANYELQYVFDVPNVEKKNRVRMILDAHAVSYRMIEL
jgi:hypothetical protein